MLLMRLLLPIQWMCCLVFYCTGPQLPALLHTCVGQHCCQYLLHGAEGSMLTRPSLQPVLLHASTQLLCRWLKCCRHVMLLTVLSRAAIASTLLLHTPQHTRLVCLPTIGVRRRSLMLYSCRFPLTVPTAKTGLPLLLFDQAIVVASCACRKN
jgi:hypothetical protein